MRNLKNSALIYISVFFSFNLISHCTYAHKGHSCAHDFNDEMQQTYQKLDEYFKQHQFKDPQDEMKSRNLGSQVIQPIRITTDFTRLQQQPDGPPITLTQTNYLISISTTVVNFVQKLIKVQPNPTNNIFDPNQTQGDCISVIPSQNDKTSGIPDSDLHLYFIFNSDKNAGYLANAGFCNIQHTSNFVRPNFGRVLFNIANMESSGISSLQYQNDVMATLHEVIHVLGFSFSAIQFWYNKDTNNLLGQTGASSLIKNVILRGIPTNLLGSPNVLATARKYYDCPTLAGQQLENQGGEGSINSHWERTVIRSEIMTSSVLTEGLSLSLFTVALLKDTGFWDDVNENLTDTMYWGQGKGCNFFNSACQSTQTTYDEFTQKDQKSCSFLNDGQGKGSNADPFSDGCNVVEIFGNGLCGDQLNQREQTNSITFNKDTLNDYGYNSKCFTSNVLNPSSQNVYEDNLRCHQYQCSEDKNKITITFSQIPNSLLICETSDQGQLKDLVYQNKSIGQIKCPSNIKRLCSTQKCVNFCSYNGVCIRGQCLCNSGYGGVDCSIKCSGFINSNGECIQQCASNTFANPNNVCQLTCPDGYYPDQISSQCKPCDFSCSQCTGPNSDQCTACQYLTILSSNKCISKCSAGTFYNSQINSCSICPNGCSSCTSFKSCTSCQQGFNLSGTNCITEICQSPCATCISPTYCLSCVDGQYLTQLNTCSSSCPSKSYIDLVRGICAYCDSSCLSCVGPNKNNCLECEKPYFLYNQTCILSCPDGTFQENGICKPCNSTCQQCTGPQNYQCIVCQKGSYQFQQICVSSCPDGTYADNISQQCQNCSSNCLSCINSTGCISCKSGFTLSGLKCVSDSCQSPCATCSSISTFCLSCIDEYYVSAQNTCLQSCPNGQYPDNNTGQCQQCNQSCSKCIGPSDNQCLQCQIGSYLNKNQCLKSCPSGTFADSSSKSCLNCPVNCQSCLNSTECIACNPGLTLSEKNCLNPSCQKPCSTCTSPTSCLSCLDGFYLTQLNTCSQSCPSGQYQDPISFTCKNCDSSCSQCTGPSSNQCTECKNPTYLFQNTCISICPNGTYANNNICMQCNYSCEQCSGLSNNQCIECSNGGYLFQNTCVLSCPIGTFADNSSKSCKSCPNNCLACKSSSDCFSCKTGFKLSELSCVSESCNSPCATCSSIPTFCLSCIDGFYVSAQNTCIQACPSGQYPEEITYACKQCDQSCLKCTGPSSNLCLECPTGAYLNGGQCIKSCPAGTFADSVTKSCKNCPINCSNCLNSTDCVTCNSGLLLSGKNCISDKCKYPCATCSSTPTYCLSCLDGLFLSSQNTCVPSCQSGYYFDATSGFCKFCDLTCSKCTGPFNNQCIECQKGGILYQNTCIQACPSGTYQEDQKCTQCHSSCDQCTGPQSNQCVSCKNDYYLSQNTCFKDCPTSTFAASKSCESCPINSFICSSITNIVSCKKGLQLQGQNCVDLSCTSPCATCNNATPTSCLSCIDGLYVSPQNTCVSNCPKGYFKNKSSMTCSSCPTGCSTCTDSYTCTDCDTSQGYRLQDKLCTLCASPCSDCSPKDINFCLSCENKMYLQKNKCVSTCSSGFYLGQKNICYPCAEGCKECKDASTCISCDTGFQRFSYQDQQMCINSSSCFSPCATCSKPFDPTTCSTCIQNFYLQDKTCVAQCDKEYTVDQQKKICQQCPTNCKVCSNNTCETCVDGLFKYQNSCVSQCPSGLINKNSSCQEEFQDSVKFTSSLRNFFYVFEAFLLIILF